MFTVLFIESYNRTRFSVHADVVMAAGTAPVRHIEMVEGADLFGGADVDHEIGNLFVVPTTDVERVPGDGRRLA